MPGKPRNGANALAGHRAQPEIVSLVASRPDRPAAPAPPRGLLARSRHVWERYWSSALADHIDRRADMYRVERWITFVDEWERAMREYKRERMVAGSVGQVKLSAAWRAVMDAEAAIARAEEQLGMTPLARARLGWAITGSPLAEVNDRMGAPDEPAARLVRNPGDAEWTTL